MELQQVLDALARVPPWAAYLAVFLGAFVEYVFPPAPGDTLVVAAAALVAVFGWPIVPVFAVVTAGSVAGAGVDYLAGRWLARTGRIERLGPRTRAALDELMDQFEAHGVLYLVVNRFLPGVRTLFFVAAGVRRMPALLVLVLAAVSATLWNVVLLAAGILLGRNLDALEGFLRDNAIVTGVLVVLLIVWAAWRVHRTLRQSPLDPP